MTEQHNPFDALARGEIMAPAETPRLLAIDDGRQLAGRILTVAMEFDFESYEAAPAEAIERCITLRPGVVVLDPMLPELDGLAVLNDVLTLAPDTAIVLIRGDSDTYARIVRAARRMQPSGAVYLVDKPFDADGLRAALRAISEPGARAE